MAGYTSRILLTFTIPFFGFVLWFLKKKKSSKSLSGKGTQVEDSTSPALFEKHILQFDIDSILHNNPENSCENKSAMQLKETQTPESHTNASQQNGISQDTVQQNVHGCAQQNGLSHDDCLQQHTDTQDVLMNGTSQTNVQHNGVSDNATPHNSSQDLVGSDISEKNVQEKSISSNGVQQNGISPKSALQNGTQQNGTSKGKKKKSKVHEKSNTCPTDIINSTERLHLENEIELVERFEVIDLTAPAKDELLNAVNKNGMDKIEGTNCETQSSASVNGDINSETELSALKNDESAKECGKNVCVIDERNSNETQQPTQTELNSKKISTDPCTSLILPVECANTVQMNGEMMESPGASYCDSLDYLSRIANTPVKYQHTRLETVTSTVAFLGSTDSGRGGSEIHFSPTQEGAAQLSYAFEIPQKLVGLLIGRQGKNVNLIKQKTNADILIKRHPASSQNKICLITGTEDEINAALRKIREKFPPERFPNVTLSQICFLPFMPCPENLMLRLPEGSSFDVMLSATVTAGHFFLQQPTHPTFHSLVGLTFQMSEMYNRDLTAPPLPHMEKGFICAANLSNCWYRAEIDEVFYETDECRVKFLDYGGYSILPRAALRQINYQCMHVPFQATECYLGLVTPPDDKTEWPPQATAYFEELAQGQILQGFIIAYAENGVPFVQLYRITGVEHIDINMALVQKGHARYIKPQPVV